MAYTVAIAVALDVLARAACIKMACTGWSVYQFSRVYDTRLGLSTSTRRFNADPSLFANG